MVLGIAISIMGLILDIIGVIMLFFTRDVKFPKIKADIKIKKEEPNNHLFEKTSSSSEERVEQSLKSFLFNVNISINRIQEMNDTIHKKSEQWLWLIVLGFLMQLIGVLLETFYSSNTCEPCTLKLVYSLLELIISKAL